MTRPPEQVYARPMFPPTLGAPKSRRKRGENLAECDLERGLYLCPQCNKLKPKEAFHREKGKVKRRPLQYKCRECERARHFKRRYGITIEQVEAMMARAGYKCEVCGLVHGRLCVDHCHKTGKVRGILCSRCNMALGCIETGSWAINMMRYLERKNVLECPTPPNGAFSDGQSVANVPH